MAVVLGWQRIFKTQIIDWHITVCHYIHGYKGRGHILVMLESWLDETGRYVLRGCMGLKAKVCTLRAAHETDA